MHGANVPVDKTTHNPQETSRPRVPNDEYTNNLKAELVQIIDSLFDPSNLIKNTYLLNRSINDNFEIPTKYIYFERGVQTKSGDTAIINAALDNCKNVILDKNGDFVNSVRPKISHLKRKIVIENISKEKQEALRAHINSLEEDFKGKVAGSYFNAKNSTFVLLCRDEGTALQMLETLSNTEFEGEKLKSSIVTENLHQAAQEFIQRKNKDYHNQQQPQASYMSMYNQNYYPYPMPNYYNGNNYGMYPPYYMQMTGYPGQSYYPGSMDYMYQPPINPMYNQQSYNNQPHYKKSHNSNYRNDRKPYVKKPRQPRDNDNQYGNKLSTKSSSIEVNDNEFPALN